MPESWVGPRVRVEVRWQPDGFALLKISNHAGKILRSAGLTRADWAAYAEAEKLQRSQRGETTCET
jgi:hypothetical protein